MEQAMTFQERQEILADRKEYNLKKIQKELDKDLKFTPQIKKKAPKFDPKIFGDSIN